MSAVSYSFREIWRITFPVLFSMLMEHLVGMADMAFLGRVGDVALGASVLGGVFYLAFFMVGFGFTLGVEILVARRNGEKNFDRIGRLLYSSGVFLFVFAGILCFLSFLFADDIFRPLVKSDAVFAATMEYVNARIWGLFPIFLVLLLRAFFVGVTDTRVLTWNSIVLVVVNIVLDYALVFGKFGFPEMGIAGAAIASVVSEGVSALWLVGYLFLRTDLNKYGLRSAAFFKWKALFEVFRLSVWSMLQYFFAIAVWLIFFIQVEHLGESSLAAVNIVRGISMFPFVMLNAFAMTAGSLVSNLIGSGGSCGVLSLGWRVNRAALWVLLPVLLLILIFPAAAIRLYSSNLALEEIVRPVIWVMVAASLLQLPASVWVEVVLGTGNTRAAMLVEFLTLGIYTAAVIWWIGILKCSVTIAWCTEVLYQLCRFLLAFGYLKLFRWDKTHI